MSRQTDQTGARELAAKILNAAGRLDVARVAVRGRNKAESSEAEDFKRALEAELKRTGFGFPQAPAVGASIEVTIADSFQGTLYVAEIRSGEAKNIVMVLRPTGMTAPSSDRVTQVILQLQPLLTREEPILDVLPIGDSLLVLGTASLTSQRADGTAPGGQTVALPRDRPWPRDVRGRIRSSDASLQVFLPGLLCNGTASPLALSCADSTSAWPVDIADSRLVPDRNYFEADGVHPFFSAARLGPTEDPRWLVAGIDGKSYLYNSLREPLAVVDGLGSDLVALRSGCGNGSHVLTSVPGENGAGDFIEAFELIRSRAVPASTPVRMSGSVTALWQDPGGAFAVAVTNNREAGRYEAFRVTAVCNR